MQVHRGSGWRIVSHLLYLLFKVHIENEYQLQSVDDEINDLK